MGIYINPKTGSKEEFLKKYGVEINEKDIHHTQNNKEDDELIVCLVDNLMFTAAGVAFDQRELNAFSNKSDPRPKKWFLLKIEDIKKGLTKDDLETYKDYL